MGNGQYTVPDNYDNLDEVAGPSPVENPDELNYYRHESLEQSRSRTRESTRRYRRQDSLEERQVRSSKRRSEDVKEDEEENLTEVAAPPPIDEGERRVSRTENISHSENGSPTSIDQGHNEKQQSHHSPRRERASEIATQLYTISYLIFFSLLGTLARLGLQALTLYPGAPVQTGVLWANFSGSLFMGFLSEDRKLFRNEWGQTKGTHQKVEHDRGDEENSNKEDIKELTAAAKKQHSAVKKTIPLYIGLATGFCGSFTSFSSFIRDVFFGLSNSLPVPVLHTSATPIASSSIIPRNGGYDFMAMVAIILLTVTLCMGGLMAGAHLVIILESITPSLPFYVLRKFLDRIVVIFAFGSWLGAVFLAIWPPDRPGGPNGHGTWIQETWRGEVIFALVLAPLGCLLRFYASLHLNARIPSFPLGTFVVNIFGTALLGMFYDLQHAPLGGASRGMIGGGVVGCQVLQGGMDGFCGCLTTVSTWVAELNGLRRRHAYIYGATSVIVALGLLVVIMGSLKWTTGFGTPACVT